MKLVKLKVLMNIKMVKRMVDIYRFMKTENYILTLVLKMVNNMEIALVIIIMIKLLTRDTLKTVMVK